MYTLYSILYFLIYVKFSELKCLEPNDRTTWIRKFHSFGKESPLLIEVTPRPSHNIASYIIKILLEERLGYNDVRFNKVNWDNTDNIVSRFSNRRNKSLGPESHINVEVWDKLGLNSYSWNEKSVINCGPLGPKARKGLFIRSNLGISRKGWQYYREVINCNKSCSKIVVDNIMGFEDRNIGRHFSPENAVLYLPLTAGIKSTVLPNIDMIVNWYPNTLTLHNYTEVHFPDCVNMDDSLLCDFQMHQLIKVVWSHLPTYAQQVYTLVKKFMLTHSDYVKLLGKINLNSDNYSDEYYRVACDWVLENRGKWAPWMPDWRDKYKVYLPIFISDYGPWKINVTYNASLAAVKNLNTRISKNSQVEIVPIITPLKCNEDEILTSYLSVMRKYQSRMIGSVVCLCPQTFDTVVKYSEIKNQIVISSSLKSPHYHNYSHFFSTQPNMRDFNLILIKMFKTFNWKRIVIFKKDGHLLDLLPLPQHDIEVLDVFEEQEKDVTFNKSYKFLKKAKEVHRASIFVVDYFDDKAAHIVMCAASSLNMNLDNGFVFIFGPFLSPKFWQHASSHQCHDNNTNFNREYFMIQSSTNSEHRRDYMRGIPSNTVFDYLSQKTTAAIRDLGNSFERLLNKFPDAYLFINEPKISRIFVNLLENQSIQLIGKNRLYTRKLFTEDHHRVGIWQIKQISYFGKSYLVSISMFKWTSENGWDDNKLPDLKQVDFVYWGKYNKTIVDRLEESDCAVYQLSQLIGLNCAWTILVLHLFVILLFIILLAIILLCVRQRTKGIPEDACRKEFEELCETLNDIDINSTDVIINMQVGKGAFGIVFGGEAKRNNRWESVAIKLIQKEEDYQGKIDFLTEAKLMKGLEHKNVVKLIGICLNPPKPVIYLVMELILNGDLKDYLLSNRINAKNNPENKCVCPTKLTGFARDIASGTLYLHENGLLHRDLACRNCFLSEDDVVKIGDFGLTREINRQKEYYRVGRHFVLPVRWMPPEAIDLGYFSIQSDIWSFGVVLFEIVTFCTRPYYNISDDEVPEVVKNNTKSLLNYLPITAAKTDAYKLIDKCCKYRREERFLAMSELVTYFDSNRECIQPYLTDDPPHATSNNILSRMNFHNDNLHSSNRIKSNSRPNISGDSISYFTESTNFDNEMYRALNSAAEQIPFIPPKYQFISDATRLRTRKKHRSGSKKSKTNLNNHMSHSSELSPNRIDDDQEHSYASCPDNQHNSILYIDPQDFKYASNVAGDDHRRIPANSSSVFPVKKSRQIVAIPNGARKFSHKSRHHSGGGVPYNALYRTSLEYGKNCDSILFGNPQSSLLSGEKKRNSKVIRDFDIP